MSLRSFTAIAALALGAGSMMAAPAIADNKPPVAPPAAAAPGVKPAKHPGHRMNPVRRLLAPLHLSPAQLEKIKPIVQDAERQIKDIRHDEKLEPKEQGAKVREVWKATLEKVRPILTSEQNEQLNKELAEMNAHRRHPGNKAGAASPAK